MSILDESVKNQYSFKFKDFLYKEYGFDARNNAGLCEYYHAKRDTNNFGDSTMANQGQQNGCPYHLGCNCPFGKHVISNFYNKIVCKHWLKGLCKKNDQCEYLHEYNLRKMPECLFFSKNGFCNANSNNHHEDCPFQHIDPKSGILINKHLGTFPLNDVDNVITLAAVDESGKTGAGEDGVEEECEAYRLGFCYMGPQCKFKHTRPNGPVEVELSSDEEEEEEEEEEQGAKVGDNKSRAQVEEHPDTEVGVDTDSIAAATAAADKATSANNKTHDTIPRSPGNTARKKILKYQNTLCPRYLNGFCPLGTKYCQFQHPQHLSSLLIINKLKIKPDSEINTKKSDALKEARLNAIINGEILS
ncbi:hypothetical protein ACO0QE_003189 [Hanseniaspora vineae]